MTLTDPATKVKGGIAGTKGAIVLEGTERVDGRGKRERSRPCSLGWTLGASHRYVDGIYHSVG